jgi:hypothetical protein
MECMCNNCFECPYPDCIISNKEMMRRERADKKKRKGDKKKSKKQEVACYSTLGTVGLPGRGSTWESKICLT